MWRSAPSYEAVLQDFRSNSGLFLIGAGASAPETLAGVQFFLDPPTAFLRDYPSLPTDIPSQPLLSARMIEFASNEVAAWDVDIIKRMPAFWSRLRTKHALARPKYLKRQINNYIVFRGFHPSLLADYNHDGLARFLCGRHHKVIDVHGTVHAGYGSHAIAEWLNVVIEYDLEVPPDDLIMGVPEPCFHEPLERRLDAIAGVRPHFIALIGYTFARKDSQYDDHVSLKRFLRSRRGFKGNIYVIDPEPTATCEMLADQLECHHVHGFSMYWNVLSTVLIETMRMRQDMRSIDYECQRILDALGHRVVFPLEKDVAL